MPLLVWGSVALDSVETPTDKRDNVLGGSAVFFSYAASYFTSASLVGDVGDDWPAEHTALLESRKVDTRGLNVLKGEKTFRWRRKYLPNMNDRETLEVHLNVLGKFDPVIPEEYRAPLCVFGQRLADHPAQGAGESPRCRARCGRHHGSVDQYSARRVNGLVSAHRRPGAERQRGTLADRRRESGARRPRRAQIGPKFVVIKKGEHGAMFFGQDETYVMPAYPTPDVIDPTGAGDSFAGGMMGYLAEQRKTDPQTLKTALAYGTLVASFTVEDFSLERLKKIERADLERRMNDYRRMLSF